MREFFMSAYAWFRNLIYLFVDFTLGSLDFNGIEISRSHCTLAFAVENEDITSFQAFLQSLNFAALYAHSPIESYWFEMHVIFNILPPDIYG